MKITPIRRFLAVLLSGLLLAAAPGWTQPRSDRDALLAIPEVAAADVICFALYTVHNRTLKLSAQLYPLPDEAPRTVRLSVLREAGWEQVAEAAVAEAGWLAAFRVEDWDDTREWRYRVNHGAEAAYEGIIRRNPVDRDEVVVAAFTGNSIYPGHGGDIPKTDIVENLQRIQPDLLFFSGDQVYDHTQHYAYWLKFGRDFVEIIRNTPTITIPDDHDVGQPNLWGAGGTVSTRPGATDGGYRMPVEYVREVERAQTSHLPDPFDPTPIGQGIGVYYTGLTWGGISFAIIEDRKFKTGPEGLVPLRGPRADHVTTPDYDPAALDVPGAELLGDRQLRFLREWATDWRDADMKAVLSQTVFSGTAHLHGQYDNRVHADLDCNGWPQSGRNAALREMRKAFAFHIAGDQHLGTVIRYGIDAWNDAGHAFCVPSIANLYLRWWAPLEPGKNRKPGAPEHTGEFLDGLGNKMTMLAVANPDPVENHDRLTTRAAGFGLVRFNKAARTITSECWPRNVDITAPGAQQYPGWPVVVHQGDNYGGLSVSLEPIAVDPAKPPVLQVRDADSGEVLYTVRAQGKEFVPTVPKPGRYVVRVGTEETQVTAPETGAAEVRPQP